MMEEFLEATYDKFLFRVKVDYSYNSDDFWAKLDGKGAIIGVSDFRQKAKGDVAFLENARPGHSRPTGRLSIGKVEA